MTMNDYRRYIFFIKISKKCYLGVIYIVMYAAGYIFQPYDCVLTIFKVFTKCAPSDGDICCKLNIPSLSAVFEVIAVFSYIPHKAPFTKCFNGLFVESCKTMRIVNTFRTSNTYKNVQATICIVMSLKYNTVGLLPKYSHLFLSRQ